MQLSPFRALTPSPDHAAQLLSPPYDVVSRDEARAWAKDQPASFLRVTRSELELGDDVAPYAPAVYAHARANLERFVAERFFVRAAAPILGVYRLTRGPWQQTGLVGAAAVADYLAGRIKKHELTRADKEDDRTRHIDVTGAQTGPVFLAARASVAFERGLAQASAGAPDIDVTTPDGVRHEAWHLPADGDLARALTAAIQPMDAFYIADGHHRAASAARVAALRQAEAGPAASFLAVVFPHTQLRILPYHRIVKDLGDLTPAMLLARVAEKFDVSSVVAPDALTRHHFGLLLGDTWYGATLRAEHIDESDPIGSLDAALLQAHVLEPLLGIGDPRRDHRIDFVGGIRGAAELERRVEQGAALAIAMAPTTLDELFRVADAGLIMPPKSTWFEPKLADGMFVHTIDGE
ncbi:MAG: DUF1015 family protein [Myxococcota bacterium]